MKLALSLIIPLITVITLNAQNTPDTTLIQLNEDLSQYKQENPVEKVYLHTSKDEVLKGDVLYYSIYNTLGLTGLKSSKIVYVDLIDMDNNVIVSNTHFIEFGRGSGSMEIERSLSSGIYRLRAYTNWMRNYNQAFFYQRKITLLGKEAEDKPLEVGRAKIDFQFFPEGGNAIFGINNRIAFRAIGSDGYSRNLEGKIVNSEGDTITHIKTLDNGSGFFYLIPKQGESYYAQLEDGSMYPLDKIQDTGYGMQVKNLDENIIKILIQSTEEFKDTVFYILGTIHQNKVYEGKFELTKDNTGIQIELPKTQLPTGVMTFTLFNSEKAPMVERAIFINNQQDLVINTKINKVTFEKRDKIHIDITTTDTNGNPVSADLSLVVNDIDISKKEELSSNIMSYLLLESDIKGYIEEPMSYLKDNSLKTKAKLDLLMLTHGWRRILWESPNKTETEKTYALEDSNVYDISGKAVGPNDKPLSFTTIKMIAESKGDINFYETETDNVGRFTIKNVIEKGDIKLSFRGFRQNSKNAIVMNVELDKTRGKIIEPTLNFPMLRLKQLGDKDTIAPQEKSKALESKYSILDGVLLEEIKITKRRKKKPQKQPKAGAAKSMYGVTPDAVLYPNTDVFMGDVLQNLNQLPGVRVTQYLDGGILRKRINIRNSSSFNAPGGPLIVIDNVVLGGASDDNVRQIESLNPLDIERFELLTGASTAVFGTRGFSGVILIYTKRGIKNKSAESSIHQFSKYDVAREFYSPNYNVKSTEHQEPDYRTTLYWAPSLTTDNQGKATFMLFNSDLANEIQVSVEGYSSNGSVGYNLQTYGEK